LIATRSWLRPASQGCLAAVVFGMSLSATALAQPFPSHPITIVVPFPPGGISGQAIRLAAQRVSENTGWTVIIDNRGGGGGQIGAVVAKNAPADGHTLFLANLGTHAINSSLYSKLNYDPAKDFEPISLLFSFTHILVVRADSPFKRVTDLVEAATQKPGTLTFASQGIGSGGHLLGEMLKSRAQIDVVHVPYRGTAQAMPDLLAGRVQFFFDGIPGSGPLVIDGKLRALAVTDDARAPMLPDVPTMAEVGYPGFTLSAWSGLVAPAATPLPIVERINAEFVSAMRSPDIVAQLGRIGVKVVADSPEQFAAIMAADTDLLGKVIKQSGVHAE
jgi:tripartite-type tricarboxylate transporter receptor subunit TctC